MSERSQVTDKVMKHIEHTPGMWGAKIHGSAMQGAGLPDIIACVYGRFVAVECKRPVGGRLSKHQGHELRKLGKCGGLTIQCRSLEEFVAAVDGVIQDGCL